VVWGGGLRVGCGGGGGQEWQFTCRAACAAVHKGHVCRHVMCHQGGNGMEMPWKKKAERNRHGGCAQGQVARQPPRQRASP